VTSWVPAGDTERLFLSANARFGPHAAIRGGVPVIFPQFANLGPLPKHGFARTTEWALVEAQSTGSDAPRARLQLDDTPATRSMWPRTFAVELEVSGWGSVLELTLTINNTGTEPFEVTTALHTYLRVDAPRTVVRGLNGVSYLDSTAGGARRTERDPEIAIRGEINRIYLDAPGPVEVVEPRRAMRVEATGFPDVVVWNPGPGSETALGDMEPGGAARMVCVEAAAVGKPVVVAPAATWTGTQRLTALRAGATGR
jgi:glucose-6-phosphate 1-epimerase